LDLKNRFWKLQSIVHPDKYTQKDDKEKQLSEEHSSFLNNAYKTLRNPFSRANYLLAVLTNFKETSKKAVDNEFAMKMMELNEEIEELNDVKALEEKLADVEAKLGQLFSQLEECFKNNKLEEANKILDALRYFNRAKTFINKKLGRDFN